MDDVGLNSLPLDNWLDGLVYMMMNVLASNSGSSTLAVSGSIYMTLVLEAGLLFDQVPLDRIVVTVIKFAVLNCAKFGSVLLGKNLTVLDRLDCTVVVVLVDFFVNSSLNFLVNMGLDNLMLYSRGNSFMDSGVMMSRLGHKVGDSCLGLVHCGVL